MNGAQSGDDGAFKNSVSISLAAQTTSEVFTSQASNDFFLPTSKKRVKLRQSQVEIKETTSLHGDINTLTPISKRKRKVLEVEPLGTKAMSTNVESSKSLHGREKKLICNFSVELEATNADNSFPSRVDIDLWKEAKLSAEENARLSVGKPTHPFFSRPKSTMANYASPSQSNAEEGYVDCLLSGDLGELPPSLPYHVTQVYESMETIVDWKNTKLLDAANIFQSEVLSIARKSSDSIRHSTLHGSRNHCLLNNSRGNALSTILCMSVEEFSFRDLHSEDHSKIQEKRSIDSWLQELFEYLKKRSKSSSFKLVNQDAQSSNICEGPEELTIMKLKEILNWYCSVCPSSLGQDNGSSGSHNILWTDKYQPRTSKQVCGNKDSLSFLNTWLHSWKVRIACARKRESTEKLCSAGNRRGWSQDNSDEDIINSEEEELCNAVLLTGPVGSGKSAAVYACAKEQGFSILEINASELRNGILIKHKFGEAMESHGLSKWSADENINPAFSPVKEKSENTRVSRYYKGEDTEMNSSVDIHSEKHGHCLTGKDIANFQDPGMQENVTENALDILENQRRRMTLILFEDVDVIFEEDRGFLTALVQLAKTTKRPLILTSNKLRPRLPQLDKLAVQLSKPSIDDLVTHIFMVCISENMPSSPEVIEHLVRFCNHDFRRLMMMLQFWGQRSGSAVQSEKAYSVSQNNTDTSVCQHATEYPSQNMTSHCCNFGNPCDFLSSDINIGECCISCLKEQDISSTRPREESQISEENINVSSTSGSLKEVIVDEVSPAEQSFVWALQMRLLFTSNAHHCVLPHLLSLSYPCPLSQFINDKVIKAVQERDRLAERFAAELAEVKVAMDHTENRKVQRLKKKLKGTTNSPTKGEENITAVSNTSLEYGVNDGALAGSSERVTINNSPLHCASKQPASKVSGRRKAHHSFVFSDSEDEGLGAGFLDPEAEKRFNCDLPNERIVDDMSVEDIYGSLPNALLESIGPEKHQETMSVQNHTQICLPDNKPEKFRRLKRLTPGSKTTATFDVSEKCDEEDGNPCSKLEKNSAVSVIREVPVVNSESQLSEKRETFTHIASDCQPSTEITKECLLEDGRKFKEDVYKRSSDVGSTNDEVTFPLNHIAELLASSQSGVAGNSCMTPSITDATLNFLNLNPVSKLWSMLSESKEGTAMTCAQTSSEALEVSRLLASFEDVLSATDVISTVKEPQLLDSEFAEEVASNLAQFGLGLCLQQCQNACAQDLFDIGEKPILRSDLQLNVGPFCFERELTRHETKFQLQEMLDSILSVKAMAATKSSFLDFSTFIAHISQLEQLRQSNNSSRGRRTRKQHYLDSHTFPVFKRSAPALNLSNFGAEDS